MIRVSPMTLPPEVAEAAAGPNLPREGGVFDLMLGDNLRDEQDTEALEVAPPTGGVPTEGSEIDVSGSLAALASGVEPTGRPVPVAVAGPVPAAAPVAADAGGVHSELPPERSVRPSAVASLPGDPTPALAGAAPDRLRTAGPERATSRETQTARPTSLPEPEASTTPIPSPAAVAADPIRSEARERVVAELAVSDSGAARAPLRPQSAVRSVPVRGDNAGIAATPAAGTGDAAPLVTGSEDRTPNGGGEPGVRIEAPLAQNLAAEARAPKGESGAAAAARGRERIEPAPESSATAPADPAVLENLSPVAERPSEPVLPPASPPVSGSGVEAPVRAAATDPASPPDAEVRSARLTELPAEIERLANAGGGTARLRLNPPSLGQIELEVQMRGDTVAVRLVAHEGAARAALEDGRAMLADGLAGRSLRMETFEVSSSTPAGPDLEDRDSSGERDAARDGTAADERGEPRAVGAFGRRGAGESAVPPPGVSASTTPTTQSRIDLRV